MYIVSGARTATRRNLDRVTRTGGVWSTGGDLLTQVGSGSGGNAKRGKHGHHNAKSKPRVPREYIKSV